MKCVGYDAEFQRQVVGEMEKYIVKNPPAPSKGKKGKKATNVKVPDSDEEMDSKPGPSVPKVAQCSHLADSMNDTDDASDKAKGKHEGPSKREAKAKGESKTTCQR